MAKRKKPCDVPSITTFFAKKSRLVLVLTVPSVRVSLTLNPLVDRRCEVESGVFTTPGDPNPVAEYDVGKLLDL